MWAPKCEKVGKPWVLRLKHCNFTMSDEERREWELKDRKGVVAQKEKWGRNLLLHSWTCCHYNYFRLS